MFKKLLLSISLVVALFTALSAGAANYNWNGTTSTDWFTTANWSRGAGVYPWPGNGDSPRLGVAANVYPPAWPHYNGYNTNSTMVPTTGAFLLAGVTNTWFYMEGGYYLHNSWVNIGNTWPYTGHWIQTGGVFNTYSFQRQFTVAAAGNGDLQISGGTIQADNWVILRNNPGANPAPTNAWALLSGSAIINCTSSSIGIYGTAATLTNRDNAQFNSTNSLGIGGSGGGIGHFYQEGGLVTVQGSVDYGLDLYTNGSQYVLSGGTLSTSFVGSTYTNSGGEFVFDGGTLRANGVSQRLIRPIGSVQIRSGKTAYISNAGYEMIQSGVTGGGGLTKLDGGLLEFDGTNTYTGPTLVSTGTVVFASSQFLNNVTANDHAGIGTAMSSSDNQAQLATLTMGSGGTFNFTLGAGEASPALARIVLTNGLVLNGPVTVNPTLSAVPAPGTLFNLLDYGTVGVSGSGSITLGTLPCGMLANLVTNGTVIGLYVTRGADKPVIDTPPASLTVGQNQPASMSITVTECADFVGYQWVRNVTNVIAGATNTTFSLTLAQMSDAGSYTVVVTNVMGAVTSTPPAVLTVVADTTAPIPLSASRPNTPQTTVRVVFNELLDQTSAQISGNYDLTNLTGVADIGAPLSATLATDLKTVSLVFSSPLADNTRYAVRVAGVKDLALNTQTGVSVPVTLLGVLQPVGSNRLMVMEAEDADVFTPTSFWDGTMRNWDITGDRPGYSGWAAVQCLPNTGYSGTPTFQGPVASYNVNFPATDTYPITYYLWVRGAGTNSGDDSCNATLDWSYAVAPMVNNMAQNMYQPNASGWGWTGRSDDHGLPRAILTVPSAGLHTVDLLMREDGFYCDKLVLTTDSAYDPSALNGGLGPEAVTRAYYPPSVAFIPGTLVYAGGTFKMNLQTAASLENIVEYTASLAAISWLPLTNFVGDGSVQTITDSSPSAAGRCYRARVVVP